MTLSQYLDQVKGQITAHYNYYKPDGIFLDQVYADGSTEVCNTSMKDFYKAIHDHIKTLGGAKIVVMNAGRNTEKCFMDLADIVVNFEGPYDNNVIDDPDNLVIDYKDEYLPFLPAWTAEYHPGRFWHIIHSTSTSSTMLQLLTDSKDRNARWVYVTDGVKVPVDTRYNHLPTVYWTSMLTNATFP